jgi:hypothetical protein
MGQDSSSNKSWVTLATSIISAAAIIVAAIVAAGAKTDRETSGSEIHKLQELLVDRDAEIQKLRSDCARLSPSMPASHQPTHSADVVTETAGVSNTAASIAEGGRLKVELQECALRSDTVTCSFLVTSGVDLRDEYLRSSRLIEANGNELAATAQQFGLSRAQGNTVTQVDADLVRNVPIRASVTFIGVNPELSRKGMKLIELHFDEFNARFSDVQAK